jgi:carboxypeptidase C (cathepsin A)
MTTNRYLKVYVGNGYYDLGTPYFATEYTFNHMELDPEIRKNITMAYYEAGHMMYMHLPSLAQMKKDLTVFIDSAIQP